MYADTDLNLYGRYTDFAFYIRQNQIEPEWTKIILAGKRSLEYLNVLQWEDWITKLRKRAGLEFLRCDASCSRRLGQSGRLGRALMFTAMIEEGGK